jgi:hypothetical protein
MLYSCPLLCRRTCPVAVSEAPPFLPDEGGNGKWRGWSGSGRVCPQAQNKKARHGVGLLITDLFIFSYSMAEQSILFCTVAAYPSFEGVSAGND